MSESGTAGTVPSEPKSASDDASKKKVRPGPPPPSAAISTASAVVRGCLAAVLGQKLGGVSAAVQPILSEPGAAKIAISLKGCAREAEMKSGNGEAHAVVLGQVQAAVARVLEANLPVQVLQFVDADGCAAALGDAATDEAAGGKADKKKKEKKPAAEKRGDGDATAADAAVNEASATPPPPPPPVNIAYVAGLVVAPLAVGAGAVSSLASLGSITFDMTPKKGCAVDVGKKAEVVIKFVVTNASAEASAAPSSPAADSLATIAADLAGLNVCKVRDSGALEAVAAAEKVAAAAAAAAAAADQAAATAAATAAAEEAAAAAASQEMVVDPWTVSGKIDYDKLIDNFGSKRIDAELLARVEKLTVGRGRVPCLHPFLRRGIFFSHRDLSAICSAAEAAEAAAAAAGGSGSSASPPFYLYTGRGPSSAAMHLGHLVPFLMTQWLQKAFDVPLVIQMTDDEKFLWKGEYKDGEGDNLEHYHSLAVENAKDIIACGFDKSKTFIFSDLDYVGSMYPNIVRIWKAVTYSQAKGCFGFEGSSNIGQSAFPAIQAAPSFPSSFPVPLGNQNLLPCLIPCAIDQDPYFRITRDIAHKIVPTNHPLKGKPALLHSKFFPPLEGALGKMSSSNENSAVFLTDSPDAIAEKIKTHAFSGGQATKALQEEKGADLEVDVAYQWLSFFLDNDEELAAIGDSYSRGQGAYWSTGLVKDKLVDVLQKMVAVHQARRDTITNDEVLEWMATRPLV